MQHPDGNTQDGGQQPLSAAERRTLDAIFRHPLQHNLDWSHVAALVERLGEVEQRANSAFSFRIGRETHIVHKPHTKDLASTDVLDLRHFLERAGCSPEMPAPAPARPDLAAPSVLVAVDHHGAKIYHIDVSPADASEHLIRPYDPHHFLHHMKHKDQSRERGQKPAEDTGFYVRIAEALANSGHIVVVGHGKGDSNAAHHLTEYLREHHRDIAARIVADISADLSSLTDGQLLALGTGALHGPKGGAPGT
jgi:hypothetical protein